MTGQYDVDEAIRRIQAYEAVGADCVYVPAPPDVDALRQIIASVNVPVNVLMSGKQASLSHAELSRMGAARLSTGGAFSRVAYGAAITVARGMLNGDFTGLTHAIAESELNSLLTKPLGGDQDA